MAAKKRRKKPTVAMVPPTIHEAERASGPTGVVYRGREIDLAAAVERRRAGLDVVVCGPDVDANRQVAKQLENAVGPYKREDAHREAGPHALPHFHQRNRDPNGHTFYETDNPTRKARRRS